MAQVGARLGGIPDMPALTSTYPAEDQTLLPSGLMALVFDEPIKIAPGATFTFSTSAGQSYTLNLFDSRVAIVGDTMAINMSLAAGQTYHLAISANAITDLSGNPLSSAIALDFNVASGSDTAAPTLLSTAPLDGASSVQPDAIVFQFNEKVQAGAGNFYIHAANGTVVATIAASSLTSANFNAGTVSFSAAALQYNTSYYITIDDGAIKDLAGNAFQGISQSTTLNFTTGPDITPPNLAAISPYFNTQVRLDANIVLTYNEAVVAGTGNIVINGSNGFTESISVSDTSQVSFAAGVATINPAINLPGYDQFFTLTLPAGLVKDTAGNASLYGLTMNFGTIHDPGDVTPPVLVNSDPADNATNVDWRTSHSLIFDETVKVAGSSGGIHIYNADGILAANAVNISYFMNTVSFGAALQPSSSYYIVIDSGFITDVNGNGFAGISSPSALNFSTAPMPLQLLPGQPTTAPGSNGFVSIHPTLELDYNEAIHIGSGNIYIYAGNGALADTISVTDASHVSISGNELLVTTHNTFQSMSEYYMLMDAGITVDSHGTGSDAVTAPFTVLFIPKAVPPSLTGVTSAVKVTDTLHGATLSPNLVVQSPDSAVLSGATVQIGGWLTGDRLSVDVSGTSITAAYDGQGTLTLSGSDSLADYQSVLRRVQFVPAQENGGPRTVQWMVKDGNTSDDHSGFYQTTVTVANIPITGTQQTEASFISSVNPDGTLALQGFYAWNEDTPATYGGGFTQAMKWGSDTAGTPGGTINYYFDANSNWTAAERQAFAAGLALWSAEANISFVQTTNAGSAQITFVRNSNGIAQTSPRFSQSSGEGVTGGSRLDPMTSATVSIDTSVPGFGPIGSSFTASGGYPWQTLLHEEGHAIGLGHAGPYDGSINPNSIDSSQFGPFDSRLWSIMSYINPSDTGAPYYGAYSVHSSWGQTGPQNGFVYPNQATTPMELDILAAQRLYGTPTSTPLSGGQVFGFNSNIAGAIAPFFDFTQNATPIITFWDSGSGNTLDLSGYSTASTVNLNPGTFSSCDGLTDNICIAFSTAIDTFIGGSGTDVVTGNDDGDHIYGGLSGDILTGGAGDDVLSGGGGNDALDGGAGTNTAVEAGNYANYIITHNNDGTISVSSGGETDALRNIQFIAFADRTISVGSRASADFDGGGISDLIWQNTNGQVSIWLLNGSTAASQTSISNPGPAWHVMGTGDFDGDRRADILWQNDSGQASIWEMNGTTVVNAATIADNPGPSWHVRGAGDFDGDGKADLIWQNDSGQASVWLMNGTSVLSAAVLPDNPGPAWHVMGTGDFDGDGKADLLWQNDSGQASLWLMNGTSVTSRLWWAPIRARAGTSKVSAISTATANRTFCGRMIPARCRSG